MHDFRRSLAALSAFPAELQQLLAGVDDTLAHRIPAANEWSVVEVIGHLIDIDPLQIERVDRILAEERPQFTRFDADAAVHAAGYARRSLDDVLTAFIALRQATVDGLSTIEPDELDRVGIRYTGEVVTLRALMASFAAHDQNHAQQIRAALAPKG
ncbi:MAG: hypothetical protein RLY87_1472 [Chloroflexota bacterium]|jgi:hypothetical protein